MTATPAEPSPWATVVIVNYNAGEHLRRAVEALARQTFTDFLVLVHDNGSADGSLAGARDAVTDPRFRFIEAGANLGFAAANNRQIEGVSSPWIATLNPDAFPEPDWLAALHRATRLHPEVAAFGSTLLDADDPQRLDGCGDVLSFTGFPWRGGHKRPAASLPPEGETFSVCAAAALYRSDAFREAGGFDERFFCFVEDVDLGYRLRLLGHRCRQVNAAVVHHVGGASADSRLPFALYHGMRNSIWCFVKNTPGPLFWPLVPITAGFSLLSLAVALRRGYGRPIAKGLADAMGGLGEIWRDRRRIQARRRIGARDAARLLCWSLAKMRRREPVRLAGPAS